MPDHERHADDADHDHGGHDHDHGSHDHDHGSHDHDHGGHDHEDDGDTPHHHHDLDTVSYAILTVSSSRSLDDDPAGDAIAEAIEAGGGEVAHRELVADDYDGVQGTVDNIAGRDDVDCLVTTGGTGVTPDDVTVEAVQPLFSKELPGFGELFRRLSYDEIGSMVVATRAVGGVVDGVPVFCLPGSASGARLGTAEIVTEQAGHLCGLATRGMDDVEDHDPE